MISFFKGLRPIWFVQVERNIFLSSFLILALLFLPSPKVLAQKSLNEQLQGKNNFYEIMDLVEQYFAKHPEESSGEEEFESDLLRWKRWEWYMSGRLGRGGEIINISEMLMKGTREKEKMVQPPSDRSINSGWTFMGPSTSPLQNPTVLFNGIGRVDKITFHPTNPNIIFICTPAGGLWSTQNGGSNWNNLTDNLPCIGASGFIISYANSNVYYLLTGDGDSGWSNFGYGRQSIGVLKSTDAGLSWHQTGEFPNTGGAYLGHTLIQSPANPELLIAVTTVGLYRTTNGGTTWTKEESGHFWDVKFKPGDPTRVYATKGHSFYISTDSGDTWTSTSTFDINPNTCDPFGGNRMLIAVAPTSSARVYLLAAPRIDTGIYCGVWLSLNSGLSFTRQSNTPNIFGSSDDGNDATDQTNYDMAFTCQSNLSTTIYAGGCTVWKSTNSGVTWTHLTSFNENGIYPYIHPDIHAIEHNPLNAYLYVASDGGFYRSQDQGVTWTDLTLGIATSQFYHMAGWDGNINKLMGGLQDNGVKYRKDNTSAFFHMSCCDGFDVAFNPSNGEPAYATVNNDVRKYSSNGATSSSKNPVDQWFKTIVMHNTDTNIVLVGAGQGIFRSLNHAASWTNEGGTGSWSLTACPSNNARFYSSGGTNYETGSGGLYVSSNTGDTWIIKSNSPGFPDGSLWDKITDVTVRPTNSAEVYTCFGGFSEGVKVYKSINAGDSWTNLSDNLPNVPINCLAIDNDNGIYAGTDIGVFYRGPAMTDWMTWSNGLPNVPVTELIIYDDGVTKKIRAATYGRGVWQSNLAETCDAAIIVTGLLKGIRHYEASTSVNSSGFIQGGIGTFVSFQSGSYINLTEGFSVIDDSEFLGFISPCGQGGIPSAQKHDPINRSDPNSSIILLRRMWDPEDGLPYGAINNIEIKNNKAHVSFNIKKNGNVQLYAAKELQETLVTYYNDETSAGIHELDIDLSVLPDAFHYLLLFYEGKLVHYQELDLRGLVVSASAQRPTDFQLRQ